MDEVTHAYSARAREYATLLGSMDAVDPRDRAEVLGWADAREGLLVDLGSGPGHWTAALVSAGHRVVAIEPTRAFRVLARERFPGTDVRDGRAECMPLPDGSVGGVLAWYSLVHLPPNELPAALGEVARVLTVGGGLIVGFFEGPTIESFDHAVVRAHRLPVAHLEALLAAAGFAVTGVSTRTTPPHRPHGTITAIRVPAPV